MTAGGGSSKVFGLSLLITIVLLVIFAQRGVGLFANEHQRHVRCVEDNEHTGDLTVCNDVGDVDGGVMLETFWIGLGGFALGAIVVVPVLNAIQDRRRRFDEMEQSLRELQEERRQEGG